MKLYNVKIAFLAVLVFSSLSMNATEIKIEAEDAELVGSAEVVNVTLCSGGRKVGYMGGPPDVGGVRFDVTVETQGTYVLYVYYLAGESREFEITVNGNPSFKLNCPSTGSWELPGVISAEINLLQGSNSILINNSNWYAPDIDLIIVKPQPGETVNPEILTYSNGKWKLEVDKNSGKTDIYFNGNLLLNNSQSSFMNDSIQYFMEELANLNVTSTDESDQTGSYRTISITGNTADGKIMVYHNYYLYGDKEFMLTDLTIESGTRLSSNYMAPVYTTDSSEILPAGNNKNLWVPYDNDKWVRYHNLDFGIPVSGYEVGAVYNEHNRNGLIMGSVQHDTWKTGVNTLTSDNNELIRLELAAGVTSNETRDVLPHGKVKGTSIRSPRMFIGFFDDWRRGLESYAGVNEIYAPKLPWNAGKPFLWNSWGAIQTRLSYTNATEVSEYIANNLQNNNFQNDETVYINLDSYWDNITYSNLIRFAREVKQRGQEPGIYWTPFVDWAKNPDRRVEGTSDVYYRDIYIYANGKPQEIAGAWAIDPTHPASKGRMDLYLDRFLDQGFTFLKLDFLCHGALEADSFYDTEVHTGIQAYNQGMKYIIDKLDGRMYINLSIAPLFPTQYGHSRRIACDAYANIDNTEYTLNSLSYGWWLDHVYSYNDADNVVLNGVSLGENRARVTSSVITGIFCIGDDYSNSGYSSAKTRAQEFLTNPEVNRIARLTKAFYPVEVSNGGSAADMFMQTVADTLYLAIFNYSTASEERTISMDRIGLKPATEYIVHDLWKEEKETIVSDLKVNISRRDVKFLKIYEGTLTSFKENTVQSDPAFYPNPCGDVLYIKGEIEPGSLIKAYNPLGQIVGVFRATQNELNISELPNGIYFFSGTTASKKPFISKVLKQY